ncbi:carcinoembryonic antigen-related cell adhesion molecule 16 isoform X2 [Anolis carolinensis]|uniref:carcinoembryonic antigen-related cell adhesion molecule 16 isoform X2 n=1 Tax=Anolis carolinensis TaxID=28377 RepID=UPI002F2B36F4
MGVLLGRKGGWPPSLLAAFALSLCFSLTGAYMELTNIVMNPSQPKEGGTVRLTPSILPYKPVSCRWYRREMTDNNTILAYFFSPSPATRKQPKYTGRETMRPDCSLEITRLNITDTGNYIVLIYGRGGIRAGSVRLVIPDPNDPNAHGRGLSTSNILAIIIGSIGGVGVLCVVLFLMYPFQARM